MKRLLLLALLCVSLAGCNRGSPFLAPDAAGVSKITAQHQPSKLGALVPDAAGVSKITAQLYNRPDGGKDVEAVEVPKKSYQGFLSALNGAKYDRSPAKWEVLGHIKIEHASRPVNVSLFWTGKEIGAFRANDIYYRGGSDATFIQLITDARNNLSEQDCDDQPADESKPEGKEKPKPESEGRSQ